MNSTTSFTLSASGAPAMIPNGVNVASGGSISVSYTIGGAPATLTITIGGIKASGDAAVLDSYTGTTNTTRTVNLSDTYTFFRVTAVWAGGQNVSVGSSVSTSGPGQTCGLATADEKRPETSDSGMCLDDRARRYVAKIILLRFPTSKGAWRMRWGHAANGKPQFRAILLALTFCPGTHSPLEARIDGPAVQGQDSEGTFVDPAKRLLANESFESFDSKSEFAERHWMNPPGADLGFLRPAPDEIHDLVPRIMRNPDPGQSSPTLCSALVPN
jgi:hypothetical protein